MKPIVALFFSFSALWLRAAEPAPPDAPTQPADRFFDSGGVRIRYIEQGRGPAVVLIHGYIANADRHWVNTGVFANLAKDYRVIALDCRGHGRSDKPTEPAAYGAEMSRDVARLLDHLEIRRAHIVGFSMGAFIVGKLLATHPDRFLSATFAGHHAVRTLTPAEAAEDESWAQDAESDTPFRKLIVDISPRDAPPSEERIRELSRSLAATSNVKALAAYHRGRRTLAVSDAELARIRVPSMGIIGGEDPSAAGVQVLRKVMPALTSVVVVEGATHGGERGLLRHPEFLGALREFLARFAPKSGATK